MNLQERIISLSKKYNVSIANIYADYSLVYKKIHKNNKNNNKRFNTDYVYNCLRKYYKRKLED